MCGGYISVEVVYMVPQLFKMKIGIFVNVRYQTVRFEAVPFLNFKMN